MHECTEMKESCKRYIEAAIEAQVSKRINEEMQDIKSDVKEIRAGYNAHSTILAEISVTLKYFADNLKSVQTKLDKYDNEKTNTLTKVLGYIICVIVGFIVFYIQQKIIGSGKP